MENGFERCDNTKGSLVLAPRVAAMEGARIMIQCARRPGDDASVPVTELEEEILIGRVRTVRIRGEQYGNRPFRRVVLLSIDTGTFYFYGIVNYLVWDPENPDVAVVYFVATDSTHHIKPLTVAFALC